MSHEGGRGFRLGPAQSRFHHCGCHAQFHPPVLWSLVALTVSGAGPAHSDCVLTPGRCEICGYQCRQRASLNWHMKKHMAEVQYNFTCERCGKRFEKLDSIKFHTLKSHPDHKPA